MQNVDINGPHHRCFELIVSSSFNQPMVVERGRSHELVASIVGAVYVHVLRTLTDNLILMRDWNAVVEEGKEGSIGGKYGLGKRNESGDRLVEFCAKDKLVIARTLFKNHKRRIYTWKMPGDIGRYQIDYILVKQRFRN